MIACRHRRPYLIRTGHSEMMRTDQNTFTSWYGVAKSKRSLHGRVGRGRRKYSAGAQLYSKTEQSSRQTSREQEVQVSVDWLLSEPLDQLKRRAAALRDEGHKVITFSPKVFLPLTRLCRDSCGYCTFALPPTPGRRAYLTLEEVVEVAALGVRQGCAEALLTLGDKPELLYPEAQKELEGMGFASTIDYVVEACGAVLRETGMLPHVNAGVMGAEELAKLRAVSGSQGLMLETTSLRLMQPGMPHSDCPDKVPAARLATIRGAGQLQVPYTSGILIGIGETRQERLHALLELRGLHQEFGHIQELIIQNFQAKKNTAMEDAAEPPLQELLWTVAVARILFGPSMNIQAPPNLTPGASQVGGWRALLGAGINDWGGLSPLTRDFVNPEKPWPHLLALADATAAEGMALVPRLTLYPEYALEPGRWLDSAGRSSVAAAVVRLSDSQGFLRGSAWAAGMADAPPAAALGPETLVGSAVAPQPELHLCRDVATSSQGVKSSTPLPRPKVGRKAWGVEVTEKGLLRGSQAPQAQAGVLQLLERVMAGGGELTEDEIVYLFGARGADFDAVCSAADVMRERLKGDVVTYGVVRNINYTNVCTYGCGFCAFSKGRLAEDLRGAPYLLPLEEISRRTAEAWERGASEVCMQGGIHPDFTGDTYLRILEAAKSAAPGIHVHAFSPLEVSQGAATLGWPASRFLAALRDAGLGSLPGTAAEVLDDGVRALLCPDKLGTAQWLEVIEAAHGVGLKTSSTIMFGHCDMPRSWARHLLALRELQARTGGFTEFVPLPFVHMEAPIYIKGRARKGPTLRECYLMHSVGRLALANHIDNIQASWVKMGPERAVSLMKAGCNDMGGTLMNESITKAAGASHGQELAPERMEQLIYAAGRIPRQRTTSYTAALATQTGKSFGAAPLAALDMERFQLTRH